jgi:hypothetical protein
MSLEALVSYLSGSATAQNPHERIFSMITWEFFGKPSPLFLTYARDVLPLPSRERVWDEELNKELPADDYTRSVLEVYQSFFIYPLKSTQ